MLWTEKAVHENLKLSQYVTRANGTIKMFGVVIWSDHKDRKAVIWCEDHGDLAFCQDSVDDRGCILDTGDLIQFDVTFDRAMRLVQHPRKVSEGAFQGLADTLRMLPADDAPVAVPFGADDCLNDSEGDDWPVETGQADIIPFEPRRVTSGDAPVLVAERVAR